MRAGLIRTPPSAFYCLAGLTASIGQTVGDRSTVMVESGGHGRRAREGTGRELHHPGRLAAPQRRAAFSADEGTPGGDGGGDVGGGQRRSQRKRRLSVRQTPPAPDRWADSVSQETHRCRTRRRSGDAEKRSGGEPDLLRRD